MSFLLPISTRRSCLWPSSAGHFFAIYLCVYSFYIFWELLDILMAVGCFDGDGCLGDMTDNRLAMMIKLIFIGRIFMTMTMTCCGEGDDHFFGVIFGCQ
jgi:hypothetical protein